MNPKSINTNEIKFPKVNRHLKKMATFMPQINQFEGEPALVDFFFNSIKELSTINGWDATKTVSFLKSKLTGSALTFYIQSQECQNQKDINKLHSIFKEFFSNDSNQSSILDLSAFSILPGESIKSLSHRLENLVSRIYNNVKDQDSRNVILQNHLLHALPLTLKTKILEENITDYKETIKRAQQLQNIQMSMQYPQNKASQFDELTKKVQEIHERINVISTTKPNSNQDVKNERRQTNNQFQNYHRGRGRGFSHSRHITGFSHDHNHRVNNYDKTNSYLRFNNRNSSFVHTCQFCGLRGHVLARCFKFQRLHRNSNTHFSNLNPRAPSFNPNPNNLNPRRG